MSSTRINNNWNYQKTTNYHRIIPLRWVTNTWKTANKTINDVYQWKLNSPLTGDNIEKLIVQVSKVCIQLVIIINLFGCSCQKLIEKVTHWMISIILFWEWQLYINNKVRKQQTVCDVKQWNLPHGNIVVIRSYLNSDKITQITNHSWKNVSDSLATKCAV